jgi:hypothetical protein
VEPIVICIREPGDELADAVGTELEERGICFRAIELAELGEVGIRIRGSACSIDGVPVAGVLSRGLPNLNIASRFGLLDQPFCNSELGAAWLAVLNLPSVLAINRYTAGMWYEHLHWQSFRGLLKEANIPTCTLTFGGDGCNEQGVRWLSYVSSEPVSTVNPTVHAHLGSALTLSQSASSALWVCGKRIHGAAGDNAEAAARYLNKMGVALVEIWTEPDGSIFLVNPQPSISDPRLLGRAATLISNSFYVHLHHW